MNNYEKLIDFVSDTLCNGNRDHNADAFDDDRFDGGMNVRIAFYRRNRELYNKLLRFCAENDITVVKTTPATLETVVRIEMRGENEMNDYQALRQAAESGKREDINKLGRWMDRNGREF